MRIDLRLRGKTNDGLRCVAHVTVYADSLESLRQQTDEAAALGPWFRDDETGALIPDDLTIVVERIEHLNKP